MIYCQSELSPYYRCTAVCDPGFVSSGRRTVKCRHNSKYEYFWKTALNPCITCGDPQFADSRISVDCHFNPGERKRCVLTCPETYNLQVNGHTRDMKTLKCRCPRLKKFKCRWYHLMAGEAINMVNADFNH